MLVKGRGTAACLHILLLSGAIIGLAGCSTVGPVSIAQGRTPYNEIIQNTSEQQTLLNLVRVHDGETPLFMDVTEVDAASLVQGTISGGPSNIGSTANPFHSTQTSFGSTVGSITSGFEYQESPTVRYQPLLGAALIAQVATPITADSIADLFNSEWRIGAILNFTAERVTPGNETYYAAIDALMELERYGALVISADHDPDKSDQVPPGHPIALVRQASPPPKENDYLQIFFQSGNLRNRFYECDIDGRTHSDRDLTYAKDAAPMVNRLWERLQAIVSQKGKNPIILRVKMDTGNIGRKFGLSPPMLRTRSALGMLKSAAEGGSIEIGSKEKIDAIINANGPNPNNGSCEAFFYNLEGGDNAQFTKAGDKEYLNAADIEKERKFGSDRRLILIQQTAEYPSNARIAVNHGDIWYSIRDDDQISKRNLSLVAEIDTIQAIPTQNPPLTPSITVSAGR